MRPDFESLPDYEQLRVVAVRGWWEGLTDEQRVRATADRSRRTALARVRRKERASLSERIITMFDAGEPLDAIAARFGWSQSNLRKRCATFGIPISSRAGNCRAPAIWLRADHAAALAALAQDRGEEAAVTLATLVGFQLADDAAAARRDTRTPRRAA